MDARARLSEHTLSAKDVKPLSWDEWHRRLAHTGYHGIVRMVSSGAVTGLDIDKDSEPSQCDACIQAKFTRKPFPHERQHPAENKGDLTHTDLWGPVPKASLGGSLYYISFVDDFTCRSTVMFLKKKSDTFSKIVAYIETLETQLGTRVKAIQSDKGGEFSSDKLKDWAGRKGIELQNTAPYLPQQNCVATQKNPTWLGLTRVMISARDLPPSLWAEAVRHAVYVRNLIPGNSRITPHEKWFGQKPDIAHLREWGCDIWVYAELKTDKLSPRAHLQVFVGFEDGPKAIRYYKRSTHQVLISRDFAWTGPEPQHPAEMWLPLEGENGSTSGQPQVLVPATAQVPTTTTAPAPVPVAPIQMQTQSTTISQPSAITQLPFSSQSQLPSPVGLSTLAAAISIPATVTPAAPQASKLQIQTPQLWPEPPKSLTPSSTVEWPSLDIDSIRAPVKGQGSSGKQSKAPKTQASGSRGRPPPSDVLTKPKGT